MQVSWVEVYPKAGRFILGLVAIALTAAVGVASAQSFRGSIVGTVLDQSDAPVLAPPSPSATRPRE